MPAGERQALTEALQLAVNLHAQGRVPEAERAYRQVLAFDRRNFAALHNLGRLALHQGRVPEAIELLRGAVRANPAAASAHSDLGIALASAGRNDEALGRFERVLRLRPDAAEAHLNFGVVLQRLERHDQALAHFDRAQALGVSSFELHNNRGNALHALGRHRDAVASLETAVALNPHSAEVHRNLASALLPLDRHAEAIAHYERAIEIEPAEAQTHADLAAALQEFGQSAAAQRAYEQAIALAPSKTIHYWGLADTKRFTSDDPLPAAMEALLADTRSPADRMHLHFALGKAYDDLGERERAFEHLLAGNALKRQAIAYDERKTLTFMARTASVFSAEFIAARRSQGHAAEAPVFIVGMPRSGTTLVEQILAGHPQVYAAGELPYLARAADALRGRNGESFPEALTTMDPARLVAVGTDYVAATRALAPAAARITDKTPTNFHLVGLMHLALPHATIIHVRRDAVDTCLSCFSKLFTEGNHYSYDLGELGRYYRAYEQLMGHWREVLPQGRMLELSYEEIVADLESTARRLIAHCGMPWDDACLAFHEQERPVRTASASQVRLPLYATSVGRWRAYGERISPLLAALGLSAVELPASM